MSAGSGSKGFIPKPNEIVERQPAPMVSGARANVESNDDLELFEEKQQQPSQQTQ